jgi:hypothetical protein
MLKTLSKGDLMKTGKPKTIIELVVPKKKKIIKRKTKAKYLDDSSYAKQLIRPIGEDIADELADFFDLEKVDRDFAKKLMEKVK